MPFLDSNPDLSGTILTQENLRGARNYLKGLISSLDPKWLGKPKGELRSAWNNDGQSDITFLIDLAFHLAVIEKVITVRSRSIFEDKVLQLLRTNDPIYFENLLTELRVLSFFAQKTKSIELDPLVQQKDLKSSNRPKTPDFSFQLTSGRILVEVTVFYFQPLILWRKNVNRAFRFITRNMLKHSIRRILGFSLPLNFNWPQAKTFIESTVLPNAIATLAGETSITVNDRKIIATWRELPHIQFDLSKHPDPTTVHFPNDRYATFDAPKGLGLWMRPENRNFSQYSIGEQSAIVLESTIQAEDATEMIVRSFRNTLDRKRDQLRSDDTHIIVCKIAHHELTSPELLRLVQERIWPNPYYEWLTGILIYIPRMGFKPQDKSEQMYAIMNPKATRSVKSFNEFMSLKYINPSQGHKKCA